MSPSFGGRGCPRGQTLPSSGAAGAGTAQVPAARCPPGGPARLSEPLTGSTGQSPAAEQLAACPHVRVRAQCARSPGPRRADPARLPHLRAPALPSAGEKAFCATWDEEQGSGGREDDPAGRMVHLGAAVGERLLCSLLAAAAAAAFGLR